MINEYDSNRIKEECRIAIENLNAIIMGTNNKIAEGYLYEKISKADCCIEFIKSFVKEGE